MELKLKDSSVNIDGISMEIVEALYACMTVCNAKGMQSVVITSAIDGQHSPKSLHYSGNAVDIRSRNWPDSIGMAQQIREILGQDFDVILEVDHLHIEFDPKPY